MHHSRPLRHKAFAALIALALLACEGGPAEPLDGSIPDGGARDGATDGWLHAETDEALADFFARHDEGREAFPEVFVAALETMLYVEDLVVAGRFDEARERLDALFARFPLSTDAWQVPQAIHGSFIGSPPAYAALRMLDAIVDAGPQITSVTPQPLMIRVVLARCARGNQPTDLALSQPGRTVELSLAPEVREDDYRVVRQSLRLFQLYVRAMTDGRLAVELAFHEVDECVAVHFDDAERSGLADYHEPLEQLAPEILQDSDMFWVLYPSNVPEGPPFETQHFITGGMGQRGASPVFIIDDKWLLRHAPHHVQGPMHDVERRAYLPQWLQHELFHHLFRTWPELGLEVTSHQWFDYPGSWPEDFVGSPYTVEPDYFAEALTKRLRGADPPLHVGLRTRAPSDALLASLTLDDFAGTYERRPVENDWHTVTVERMGSELLWKNAAGVEWSLSRDDHELVTGPECPYGVQRVTPLLARDEDGEYLPEVRGLLFQHETYVATP